MKPTRVFKGLVFTLLITALISSCTDQFGGQEVLTLQSEFNREEALLRDSLARVAAEEDFQRELLRDSLLRAGGRINYAVTVVSGANSGTTSGRGEIASGATVTVSQHGTPMEATTDASGQVVFDDMRVGNASVTVTFANHTSAAVIVDLTPVEATDGDATIDYSKVTRNAATMIPIFPTSGTGTATIEGQVLGDTDLTNEVKENIANYPITAYIDVDAMDSDYFNPGGATNADAAGRIIQITYTDIAQTVTTDASGNYSMVVPASGNGLPIGIGVSDFLADVTYYQMARNPASTNEPITEAVTVGHVFSPNNTTATDIFQVPSAFIRITAPTGGGETGSGALATAIINQGDVISGLRISDVGRGYTQAPDMEIVGDGFGAAGTISITNGYITDAVLNSGGQDYSFANVNLSFGGKDPAVSANVEYVLDDMMGMGYSLASDVNYANVTGAASFGDIVDNTGAEYITQPGSFTIDEGTNSSASVTAVAEISVASLTESAKGGGYTATPLATFSGGTPSDPDAPVEAIAAVELASGPLTSIGSFAAYEPLGGGPFTNDKTATPVVDVIDVSGTGFTPDVDADIDVTWATTGWLPAGTLLQINNAGTGYIDGEVDIAFSGAGASTNAANVRYKVRTDGDAITEIEILNSTDGWDQTQTITITVTGVGAGADVQLPASTIEYPVSGFTINTGGEYYFNTLTATEITDLLGGTNPYAGGQEGNELRLYVNSTSADTLLDADLTFNRCVESVTLVQGGEYEEGPTSLDIDAAPVGGETAVYDFDLTGSIVDLVITDGGSGYLGEGLTVTLSGSTTGTDAVVDLSPFESNLTSWQELASEVSLVGFTVDDGGAGFSAAPNVAVEVPGSGGQSYGIATATITGDAVSSVDFVSSITALSYEFSDLGDIAGSGIAIDLSIWKDAGSVEAEFATGSVVAVNVGNGGSGYDDANPPTIRFVATGTGSGATGVAVVSDGRVVRVDVTNGGSNYDGAPDVEFIEPNNGAVTGAAVAIIDEKTGAITGVQLRDPSDDCFDPYFYNSGYGSSGTTGEGYLSAPTVTAEAGAAGNGSGATFEAEINTDGEITAINVLTGGTGYFNWNYSTNFSSNPGDDVDASYFTVTNQSSNNVISGKTHIRNIFIGTGRTPTGN